MAVDRSTRLFFDATCLFAAAQSSTGGSARLIRLCHLGWLSGWASQPVLVEAERAVHRKGSASALTEYERLLRLASLQYAAIPLGPAEHYRDINPKDAHV